MAQTRINNDNIQETTITPTKLTVGAPVWNSTGNVTAIGTVSATSFLGDGSTLDNVVMSNQTNAVIITANGFQGAADHLTGNFSGNISQSTGVNNNSRNTFVNKLSSDFIFGNLTVYGQISASGGVNVIQSTTTGTSSLSVLNTGVGPALFVRQTGPWDIATFIDAEGGTVLHVNNISPLDNSAPGGVGILTETPNETLTVRGTISASSIIYSGSGIRVSGDIISTGNVSAANITSISSLTRTSSASTGALFQFEENFANRAITLSALTTTIYNILTANAFNITTGDTADYLLVAGGGGGGAGANGTGGGGGGGAGGCVRSTLVLVPGNSYTITIGAGGAGGLYNPDVTSVQGSNSIISLVSPQAVGGGFGGDYVENGGSGGSGGGGAGRSSRVGGASTLNQGFSGGRGFNDIGGGGGGAGGVGATASLNSICSGGNGIDWFNLNTYIVGGGGGGGKTGGTLGEVQGGLGGGGRGGITDTLSALPGSVNTGGGGGGGFDATNNYPYRGGNGGSGVLVIRWPSTSARTLTVTSPTSAADLIIANAGYKYLRIKESCYLQVT